MRVGVPREIKSQEYRVGLTPGAVREYVAAGHQVLVETNAGDGIDRRRRRLRKAGARDRRERRGGVRRGGDDREGEGAAAGGMAAAVARGRSSSPICTSRPTPSRRSGLIESGCTAIAYETVTDARGGLPLLAPMSEVAGRLAIEAAGAALKRYSGGRGMLIGGVPGVPPARVVGDRRRRGRHACGAHGGRARRGRVDPRPLAAAAARARRTLRGPRAHALLHPRDDRGGGVFGRRGDRRGAGARRERAEARHARAC